MKTPKRGRPSIGRQAMTAAERQARRRDKLRGIAKRRRLSDKQAHGVGTTDQLTRGYAQAMEKLFMQGRRFERARREFGFVDGVFIDGAFMSTPEVIELAELSPPEQERVLDQHRRDRKDDACDAVLAYMKGMWVSLDELTSYIAARAAEKAAEKAGTVEAASRARRRRE